MRYFVSGPGPGSRCQFAREAGLGLPVGAEATAGVGMPAIPNLGIDDAQRAIVLLVGR